MLSLLVTLVIFLHVNGHSNKFKSCSSSGFCQRQKKSESNNYYIDSNSIKITNNGFECVMLYKQNPNDNTKKLKLLLTRVINNVLRLFVTESNGIRPRYQMNDILSENARKFLPFSSIDKKTANECILSWNNKYSAHIFYNPFKISIINNGNKEIIINEFDKFYFEPYIHRKTDNETEDEKALWEERFSSHTYYYDNGPSSIGLDFTFVNNKYIYGIPEHASSLILKDTIDCEEENNNCYSEPYRLWNLDVFEYNLDVPDALYGAIPYILGYNCKYSNGILWMNSAETYIDIGHSYTNNGKNIRWMSESGVLETFIILSDDLDPNNYLEQYYKLTGYPQLPPIFSLGHHQCRWNYNNIDEVYEISDKFDELDIPNDFIWLDIEHTDGKRYFTWDKHSFENAKDMIDYVSMSGRKMVTIVDPHIKEDNNYYIYKNIDNNNELWTKNRDNNIYSGWCWPGTSRYPDFTNPKMREFWSNQFKYDNYKQSTKDLFIWNDMNEPSVFDGPEVSMPISNIHYQNVRHNEIHNLYGYYVHQSTYNGLLLRDKNKLRPFVLSRSFFSGSQQYGAIWTGDNTANWQHLKISIPMLLSLSVAGLPFVGADIGGFFNNPDGELMARWYELGAYYPFFRNHAHQDTKRRELWEFDEQYAIRMKHAILARYRILPYVYTMFYLSAIKSELILQPLWYNEFKYDDSTYDRDDAFMFGYAFYIQPIVESGVNEIDVMLPENKNKNAIFYEMSSDNKLNVYNSGKHHLIGYSSRIPVLRYGGTITIEKHRIRRSASLMKYDPITVIIALNGNDYAKGYHYMDDEETFNYMNDEYVFMELIYDNNKLINNIISGGNNNNNIQEIEVERIVIMGKDIDKKKFNQIHIKQLKNSRKTKQFGVAQHTLAIRKPQILINYPFTLEFS